MAGDSVVEATFVCANQATDYLHGSMDHFLASRLTVQQRKSTEMALIAFLLNVSIDIYSTPIRVQDLIHKKQCII